MNAPSAAIIRVLIVDDSAVVRRGLADLLRGAGLEVAGAAADPIYAAELLRHHAVDVIVLDVEMPRMDGISFLRQLMASERPLPVVMCSTLTERGARTTLDALAAGAVAIVAKPKLGLREFLAEGSSIVQAVRAAARCNLQALRGSGAAGAPPRQVAARQGNAVGSSAPGAPGALAPMSRQSDTVVVVGVSTGGVQAIEQWVPRLPCNAPGVVLVQHMPERFTASLAQRLDGLSQVHVREARGGERILPGQVLIAPGGRHTRIVRSGAHFHVQVFDAPLVNHHRPSVDVLFRSAAAALGPHAVGVIMTGMGDDGARGLRQMREAGAWTLAQDEASCVVFGMPKEAIALDAVCEVVPLARLAEGVLRAAARRMP